MDRLVSRRGLMVGGAALGLGPGVRAFAASGPTPASGMGGPPVLVSIFLRGGMDALTLIAPIDDPDYIASRAPELRLAADGLKSALRLDGAPKGRDFRLHPEAAPLMDLYRGRRIAFVHAAGITNGTRSHFGAQELIERGLSAPGEASRIDGGWIARWLAATGSGAAPAFSATTSVPQALEHHPDTICAPDLRYGIAVPGGKPAETVLAALYASSAAAGGGGPIHQSGARALDGIHLVDRRLRDPAGHVLPYTPGHGAHYEETEIGRSLQTVARVIRMDLPIRAYTVDMGGWDTHEYQAPRLANLIGQLSRGLAAFHADLADRLGGLTLVAMSEFGRRLRTNKSNGTDHGHGGVMLVSAPRLKGGAVHGRWPGLGTDQLDNRVDLAVTTDVRSVLAELIAGPLATGETVARVFPGFAPVHVGLV